MAQLTHGIRSVLSNPLVYEISQRFMGAKRAREKFVDEFISPYPISSILDIGCGPADILSFLPKLRYVGFDISESYIKKAKDKYGDRGEFFAKEIAMRDLVDLPRFDCVIMTGVLHHLDDTVARDILKIAKEALLPGGRLVTKDPVFEYGQSAIAKFLISKDRGCNVRTKFGYAELANDIFQDLHVQVRHKKWVPYTHCIMECIR